MVPPLPEEGPYTVQVLNASGKSLAGGDLKETDSGDWVFLDFPSKDLTKAQSVSVRNQAGQPVLVGTVEPYQEPSAGPSDS
jgi:hypothetical protein